MGVAKRDEIRNAAGRLFRERGFARTAVRDIAALAQTSPALVIRHFGTKELLFLDTMRLTIDDEPLLDVPLEELGERFIEVMVTSGDDVRQVYLALVRGSHEPQIRERLRDIHETTLIAPLRARLRGDDADQRVRMAGALVGGLLYALWVVGDERLGDEDLVARYGALLQDVLTGPTSRRPTGGSRR
ncbi:TetR family transcriptional regulator [Paractinoplanes atraurantiacus]